MVLSFSLVLLIAAQGNKDNKDWHGKPHPKKIHQVIPVCLLNTVCGCFWRGFASVAGQSTSSVEVLGCYTDAANRDLAGTMQTIRLNTLPICKTLCATQGYAYAGAQAGGWCLCGNSYGKYGSTSDGNCNYRCSGNSSMFCGGVLANTVMATGFQANQTSPPPNVLGCYADEPVDQSRDLNGTVGQSFSFNTLAVCSNLCAAQGYAFAGAQAGSWCFCGNSYGRYGLLSNSSCNSACSGNSSQRCGGLLANTVMATGLPAPPNSLQTPAAPSYVIGCFGDGAARDLDGWIQQLANNTLVNCRDVCKSKGYKYAGAQGGGWCLCGNSYGKYGRLPLKNCNWPCTADRSLLCGGQWANTVMITDPCSPNPCQNNGTCSQTGTSFKCSCPANNTGDKCQYTDPCVSNPCGDFGICVRGPEGNTFRCFCELTSYFGEFCQSHDLEVGKKQCKGLSFSSGQLCVCEPFMYGLNCLDNCGDITPFCNTWKEMGNCYTQSGHYIVTRSRCGTNFTCSACGLPECNGDLANHWKC